MKAFKLVKLRKNGTLGPLFIGSKFIYPVGKWLKAKAIKTKGFKFRPGFHCCQFPKADHLSEKGRIWVEVRIQNYERFQRPKKQGGLWFIAKRMKIIKLIPPDLGPHRKENND